jgi:hypothetical protein
LPQANYKSKQITTSSKICMWVKYEFAVSYFGGKRLTPSLLIGLDTHP